MSLSGVPSRRWNFLINGYTLCDMSILDRFKCRYLCYRMIEGLECDICVGFVMFDSTKTRKQVKKMFRVGTFVERAQGCINSQVQIIVGGGEGFIERGRRPNNGPLVCCRCGSGAIVDEQDYYEEDDIEEKEKDDIEEES